MIGDSRTESCRRCGEPYVVLYGATTNGFCPDCEQFIDVGRGAMLKARVAETHAAYIAAVRELNRYLDAEMIRQMGQR